MDREEIIRRLNNGEEQRDCDVGLDVSPDTCALCYVQPIPRTCTLCIIRNHTDYSGCIGTPYSDYVCDPTKYNAGRMVAFLKSLREE